MLTVQLGEICDFEKGNIGLAKAVPGIYPLVTTGSGRRTCDSYHFDTKAVCIPLVSSTGHGHASLKNVHYQEGKFALGSILVALTAKDEDQLDIQYLHLYLSELKDQILVPLMSGAANVALSVSKIKSIRIPLPNINRQREIVHKFNVIKREDHQLKTELTNQQTLLKSLRSCILQDAIKGKLTSDWRAKNHDIEPANKLLQHILDEKFTGITNNNTKVQKLSRQIINNEYLFELPKGWVWCRVGDVATVNRGKSPIYDENSSLKALNQKCVRWFYVDTAHCKSIDKDWHQSLPSSAFTEQFDILVNSTGEGTIGRAALVDNDAVGLVFDSHILCLKPKISPSYIVSCVNSTYGQEQVNDLKGAKSTKQTELGVENLKKLIFPLPSIAEQKEIVRKIDVLFKYCDELESQFSTNQTHAEQLMQAVLKNAFSQS